MDRTLDVKQRTKQASGYGVGGRMSNYDNIDWRSVAVAQNRANHPEIEAGEKLAAAQAAFKKQLDAALALNKDSQAYNSFTPTLDPVSRMGKGTMRNPSWTSGRASMEDILSYLLYNPGKSFKTIDESTMATNENDIWNTYGEYSLDSNGMLQRKPSSEHFDVGQDSGSFFSPSWSGILSGLTLGASDVVKGQMPGTDWADQGTLANIINPAAQGPSMMTGGATDLLYGINKAAKTNGSFWDKLAAGADRAIDPFGVDAATRKTGDVLNKNLPQLNPYITPIATAIGTLVYPGAGSAAGYGIGSKLAQGTKNYDYLKDLLGAGVSYLGGEIGSGVGGATKFLTGSALAGGTVGGAAGGLVAGAPAALQQKSLNPLWQGALTGAVVGGLGTGARISATDLGASNAIANLTGNVAGKVASTGMKQLWLNNNKR